MKKIKKIKPHYVAYLEDCIEIYIDEEKDTT